MSLNMSWNGRVSRLTIITITIIPTIAPAIYWIVSRFINSTLILIRNAEFGMQNTQLRIDNYTIFNSLCNSQAVSAGKVSAKWQSTGKFSDLQSGRTKKSRNEKCCGIALNRRLEGYYNFFNGNISNSLYKFSQFNILLRDTCKWRYETISDVIFTLVKSSAFNRI